MGRVDWPRAIMSAPEPALADFLVRAGLAASDEEPVWRPLTGGVSSDIWHVATQSGDFCVKRALAQLKVAAEWKAPVGRNATEWAYMQVVADIVPNSVPRPIAHDPAAGLFAMEWLPPNSFASWKAQLLHGHVDATFAGNVGRLLGTIHVTTADDADLASAFATDKAFHALRIEPYLLTAARVHPEVASVLYRVAEETTATRRVLVHGDASPKNILVGAAGPVLLDAEVAWFGDPAFDLAFCLSHLAIKRRVSGSTLRFDAAFDALLANYLALVGWESTDDLERRAAWLLPALMLARVDGKSPVEYLSASQGAALRTATLKALHSKPTTVLEARTLVVA